MHLTHLTYEYLSVRSRTFQKITSLLFVNNHNFHYTFRRAKQKPFTISVIIRNKRINKERNNMTMIVDASTKVESLPTDDDILRSVQGYFPDIVVTDWDAFNGVIYHRNNPRERIGGFLALRAYGVGADGSVMRQVEINDNARPFDESYITVIGARALANAQGAIDTAIIVRDGRPYAHTLTRIVC